jgi:ribosome-associated heat shock protein Hsp15
VSSSPEAGRSKDQERLRGEERLRGQERLRGEERLRIDKWLWAARFYKTRSLAAQAVDGGKARWNGERVKPSRELHVGDRITVRVGELEWDIEVLGLSERRGPASEAATLYRESDASRAKRGLMLAMRKASPTPVTDGRPTKRDRRRLEQFRRDD